MQRLATLLATLVLTFVIFSCNKKDAAVTPPSSLPEGVPTAVGQPTGDPVVQKVIGAEGGTIATDDGSISITFPAGALPSSQQVSIEPISNHNPLGVGTAYRLQPHGMRFSKPVTIEFAYDDSNNVEMLGIAYQDSGDVWQARAAQIDATSKKAKITTDHFSDWSLFETLFLTSSASAVKVNGSAQLEVFSTEDLLTVLTLTEEVPMGKKVSLPANYIKKWQLAGAGNLQGSGPKGTYTAPSQVPSAPNPVAVTVDVDLGQHGRFLLVKHIGIFDEDGEIEVRVAGGAWIRKFASPAVKIEEGLYAIADADGDTEGSHVLITWRGENGTHPYKSPDEQLGTYVHYLIDGGDNYVAHYMNDEDELVASGGSVTITSMGEDDGYITGTFIASPAGHGFNLMSKTTLEGKFRVKKGW